MIGQHVGEPDAGVGEHNCETQGWDLAGVTACSNFNFAIKCVSSGATHAALGDTYFSTSSDGLLVNNRPMLPTSVCRFGGGGGGGREGVRM